METDGAGTMAEQSLLSHPRHFNSASMISTDDLERSQSRPFAFTTGVLEQTMDAGVMNMMHQASLVEPVLTGASEARDDTGQTKAQEQRSHVMLAGDDAALAATILANGPTYSPLGGAAIEGYAIPLKGPMHSNDIYHAVPEEAIVDDPADESDSVIRANMRAYAKLVLPDGDFYITTPKLKVIRDMDCFREYQHEVKLARRAQRELERYAQEPSMPSQPGDGDQNGNPSSKSSQSLIGRPARALPSNFSEQGGAVAYAAFSDDEAGQRRRRKRKILSGKVSSAGSGSIAPASLHPNLNGMYGGGEIVQEEIQVLPVHPSIPGDIVKISKEHLLFFYNNAEERWELEVLGARCMVNDSQHVRGDIVALHHDDEIMVVSLTIKFKLPDQRGHSPGISHGTFGDSDDFDMKDDADLDSDLSSVSREQTPRLDLEDLASDDEAEDELEDRPTGTSKGKKRPKIKLKLKQKASVRRESLNEERDIQEKAVKLKLKTQKKRDQLHEKLAFDTEKKPEKGRNSKTDQSALPADDVVAPPFILQAQESSVESKENLGQFQNPPLQTQMSPPAPPPVIEPGSIFEGVAPEEMPQKRKGPGRPPKNGLISKRDQSFVKRKIKEYEKRGEQPPPMDELVSIVRAENKAKEAAQKAAARGEPVSEVMPSIEYDGHQSMMRQESDQLQRQQIQQPPHDHGEAPTAASFDLNRRQTSPRPKHIARSPSPIKPETEFTEEEMKKPTMTYVHILDEVLKDHPIGKADLQEIYDRICKRYPYFKYKTTTSGWQSSVRHNLLQHGRFRESGRSGKGRLWAIDYNYDLSKEKKRKLTPPPRPLPQQMQHGNYASSMPGQPPPYGQPNYQTPYGNQVPNGQQQHSGPPPAGQTPYYSPYGPTNPAHAGQYATPHGHHGSAPPRVPPGPSQARTSQPPHGQSTGNNGTSQSPAAQVVPPPAAFQVVVDGIMRYRERYLAPYSQNTAAFKFHEDLFKKCTAFVSDIFHGQAASVDTGSFTGEEQRVFNELSEVVNRCKTGGGTPAAEVAAPVSKMGTPSATMTTTVQPVSSSTTVCNTSPPANVVVSTMTQAGTVPRPQMSGSDANQGTPAANIIGALAPAYSTMSIPTSTSTGIQAHVLPGAHATARAGTGDPAPNVIHAEDAIPVQSQPAAIGAFEATETAMQPSSSNSITPGLQQMVGGPPPAPDASPLASAVATAPLKSSLETTVDDVIRKDPSGTPAATTMTAPFPMEGTPSESSNSQVFDRNRTASGVGESKVSFQGTKRPAEALVNIGTEAFKKTKTS